MVEIYSTGVSVSELVSIKMYDVKFDNKAIRVMEMNNETLRIFTYKCDDMLREYLSTRKNTNHYLSIGMTNGGKIGPFTLGQTIVTQMIEKVMSLRCIQILLGHSTIMMAYYSCH